MSRLTLTLALTLTLVALLPSQAVAVEFQPWGPAGDLNAASSPAYILPVHVIDTLASTLRPDRRTVWTRALRAALGSWTTGCLSFTLTHKAEALLPYPWDDRVGDIGFADLLTPDAVTIFRNRSSSPQMMGGWDAATEAGLAVYAPWAPWWKPYYFAQLVAIIAHELGHAIGFGHGGRGVMGGGADRPTTQELALARLYYC